MNMKNSVPPSQSSSIRPLRSTHCVNQYSIVLFTSRFLSYSLDSSSSALSASSRSSSCSCYLVILQLITYFAQYLQFFSLLCHDQCPTLLCNRHFVCTTCVCVRALRPYIKYSTCQKPLEKFHYTQHSPLTSSLQSQ
jgi:hypothetical protein